MRNSPRAFTHVIATLLLLMSWPVSAQNLDEANRLASEGQVEAAIPLYQAHLKSSPDDGPAWYALGRAAHAAGKLEVAKEAFQKALKLEFQPGGAELRLGVIALSQGDEAASRAMLQAAFDGGIPVLRMLPLMPGYSDANRSSEFDAFTARLHPCGAAEYRQFDFWIGDWEVFNPDGQKVGENRIEKILDGCALAEFWTGAGSSGRSHNRYDRTTGQWTQHWLTDTGNALDMTGSLVDGVMTLYTEGTEAAPKQRWSWTLQDDGSVRQKADQINPETGEWGVIWDSYYRRK